MASVAHPDKIIPFAHSDVRRFRTNSYLMLSGKTGDRSGSKVIMRGPHPEHGPPDFDSKYGCLTVRKSMRETTSLDGILLMAEVLSEI